jgi:hypothetical protein
MLAVNANINVKQLTITFKGSKSKRDIVVKEFHLIPHYGIGKMLLNMKRIQLNLCNTLTSMKF